SPYTTRSRSHTHTHTHTHTHRCAHTCSHSHPHIYPTDLIHTQVCTHTHAHTHILTYTPITGNFNRHTPKHMRTLNTNRLSLLNTVTVCQTHTHTPHTP